MIETSGQAAARSVAVATEGPDLAVAASRLQGGDGADARNGADAG